LEGTALTSFNLRLSLDQVASSGSKPILSREQRFFARGYECLDELGPMFD